MMSEMSRTVLVAVAKTMEILKPLGSREREAAMEALLEIYTDPGPATPAPEPEARSGALEFMDAAQQATAAVKALLSPRDKVGVKPERVARKLGISNGAASGRLREAVRRGLLVSIGRGRYVLPPENR